MSQRERDRLVVLRQLAARELSVSEGARRLGMGQRHMRRLLRRWEAEGDGAVVHGLRGRRSNRRLADALRERALEKASDPLYHDFGPTLLSEHLERDPEIGFVHRDTLRLWMIEAGLWTPKARKERHRKRRERRSAWGELLLMDTSIHAWLEERFTEEIVLIALIDDATSRLTARFFPRDTGAANRQMLVRYLAEHGRMGAVYADRAGHFEHHFHRTKRQVEDKEAVLTLIQRALGAVDIELILALSPQAKGRVERLFGTLQDRLVKEMRVAGVASLEAANRFLEDVFIPFWNERFTVEPKASTDAHRPLPEGVDLLRLFAETQERVIRSDFTFRYKNVHYQIEKPEADGAMPKSRIVIEQRLDGSVHYRWRERYLEPTVLPGAPKRLGTKAEEAAPPKEPRPLSGAAGKPIPPDHPWRRYPVRVGRGRFAPARPVLASAPAPLEPDSPAPVSGGTPIP